MLAFWAVYNFGSPECDPEGNIIEDEFSKLPIVQQYLQRMWKSMTYYQKVSGSLAGVGIRQGFGILFMPPNQQIVEDRVKD